MPVALYQPRPWYLRVFSITYAISFLSGWGPLAPGPSDNAQGSDDHQKYPRWAGGAILMLNSGASIRLIQLTSMSASY